MNFHYGDKCSYVDVFVNIKFSVFSEYEIQERRNKWLEWCELRKTNSFFHLDQIFGQDVSALVLVSTPRNAYSSGSG